MASGMNVLDPERVTGAEGSQKQKGSDWKERKRLGKERKQQKKAVWWTAMRNADEKKKNDQTGDNGGRGAVGRGQQQRHSQ
ncbi:hypothetical protein E4U15_006903 [Claviceps sp. LM218 group G6]|nr:hypothetical protein E4U15_006903 [Claviceps sp. LM218 group G6]